MAKHKYPEATVGALIFNPQGELFLMRSHKWHGNYVVPGGHIELGESAIDAIIREVREETGLDIYDVDFLCYQDFIFNEAFWKRRHFIFLDFICKTAQSDVTLNHEAQSYVWATIEDALDLPVDSYTAYAIEQYKKQLT